MGVSGARISNMQCNLGKSDFQRHDISDSICDLLRRTILDSTLFDMFSTIATMQDFVSLNLGDYLTISSLIGIALLTCVTAVFKRRYLSSISDIPGPPLASISRLWQIITLVKGDSINEFYSLHRKHGAFVRVAPNEVSVSHPEAPRKLLLAPLPKVPISPSPCLDTC